MEIKLEDKNEIRGRNMERYQAYMEGLKQIQKETKEEKEEDDG